MISAIFVIATDKVERSLRPGLTITGFHMIATMAQAFLTVNAAIIWKVKPAFSAVSSRAVTIHLVQWTNLAVAVVVAFLTTCFDDES